MHTNGALYIPREKSGFVRTGSFLGPASRFLPALNFETQRDPHSRHDDCGRIFTTAHMSCVCKFSRLERVGYGAGLLATSGVREKTAKKHCSCQGAHNNTEFCMLCSRTNTIVVPAYQILKLLGCSCGRSGDGTATPPPGRLPIAGKVW